MWDDLLYASCVYWFVGLAAGVLTVLLPPLFKPLTVDEEYRALTSNVRDVRAITLKSDNQCSNYDSLKAFYQVSGFSIPVQQTAVACLFVTAGHLA